MDIKHNPSQHQSTVSNVQAKNGYDRILGFASMKINQGQAELIAAAFSKGEQVFYYNHHPMRRNIQMTHMGQMKDYHPDRLPSTLKTLARLYE